MRRTSICCSGASVAPRVSRTVTFDGHVPSCRAKWLLRREHRCWRDVTVRTHKYPNNLIEQGHRAIKRRCASMAGFNSIADAAITIAGIELAHRIHKAQFSFGHSRRRHGCCRKGECALAIASVMSSDDRKVESHGRIRHCARTERSGNRSRPPKDPMFNQPLGVDNGCCGCKLALWLPVAEPFSVSSERCAAGSPRWSSEVCEPNDRLQRLMIDTGRHNVRRARVAQACG
jgi:hypothetical protein